MEVFIYDMIGPDFMGMVSAKSIRDQLAKAGGAPVNLRINSPGGDVFEAVAIRAALTEYAGGVTTFVDGLAASAASWVGMVKNANLVMAEGSMMMVHNAMSLAYGYAADLRKQADLLDSVTNDAAAVLSSKSGQPLDTIKAWMTAETWMTAQEAVNNGLANEVAKYPIEPAAIKNGMFRNTPPQLLANELPRERHRRAAEAYAVNRIRLTRAAM